VIASREQKTKTTVILESDPAQTRPPERVVEPQGEFRWRDLPPGKYRLYAIEDFDWSLWGNPELAAHPTSKCTAFELREGEDRHITLSLISAPEFQQAVRVSGF
jgi:hypothetical protein